jgi:hypothetical protein
VNCKKERLDSPTQGNGNILLRHTCLQHHSRTSGSRIPYSSRAKNAIQNAERAFFLRRNLNRQKAFHYRTQSYRHHTSGTQLHPQSTSSHPVCLTYHPIYVNVSQRKRTIHPTFSGAFPEIRFMSRLILSPILPIFIPPSRRGDGNSAAHGAINSKDECKK